MFLLFNYTFFIIPSWGEGASLTLVGHPSSDGVNKSTLWCRCFITLTSLAPHRFLIAWLRLNLTL